MASLQTVGGLTLYNGRYLPGDRTGCSDCERKDTQMILRELYSTVDPGDWRLSGKAMGVCRSTPSFAKR